MRVKLSEITKRYGCAVVLSQLDLDINTGEFVAVVGASGAGKSTALRIIAGWKRRTAAGSSWTVGARADSIPTYG
jgi:putative spermidine/putrescine transport system ATP-binding protein